MITIKFKLAIVKSAKREFSDSSRSVRKTTRIKIYFSSREKASSSSANISFNRKKKFLSEILAGRSVTEGQVEEMLESGNPAVFTQGVS